MSVLEALRLHFVLGLPIGLALGLLLAGPARRHDGWGGYGSFARRAARLGHVAAVMLPVIAGAFSAVLPPGVLESLAGRVGAGLWIGGSIGLPAALLVVARHPRLAPAALPLPALSLVAGSIAFAVAHLVPHLTHGGVP